MSESKASRTLVKSPPELWSEVSSAASLQRHLDRFGEIRITELEPETAVAWEGEHARGTVKLEPSGWGTKVSLTAEPFGPPDVDGLTAEPFGPPDVDGLTAEPCGPPDVDGEVVGEPLTAAGADGREPGALPERDGYEAGGRKRGWLRGLGERVRRWIAARADRDPVAAGRSGPTVDPSTERPAVATVAVELDPSAGFSTPSVAGRGAAAGGGAAAMLNTAALTAALDSLGQAHHRPFSRA